jgi:hypothetical protein
VEAIGVNKSRITRRGRPFGQSEAMKIGYGA